MKIVHILSIIMLCSAALNATVIHIPAEQATIQAGIDAAANGDTVLVAPGTYKVNIDYKGKSVYLTSEAGPLLTVLKPASTQYPIVIFENSESPLAVLDGFTLKDRYNKPAVQIYSSSPIIKNNIFTNNDFYFGGGIVYIKGNSSCLIERNLFYDNPSAYVVLWDDSDAPVRVINNTIYGGRSGLVLWGPGTIAYGNIVTNCSMGVSAVASVNSAYNNIWGNSNNWSFGSPGELDISVDPEYMDSDLDNFYLTENSPCIDAGHPDEKYDDPDGTRNDIGAIPFDQRTPVAINLHLSDYEFTNILNHYPTFFWKFYDPSPPQTAFEIEVGTDDDWAVAENWASGEVTSPDTFITYDGSPLENGGTYFYRIRVNNGTEWGIWTESVFRINSIPSSPNPVSPINQEVLSVFGIRLETENSLDAEGDELIYNFELYADVGMGELIESIENISEQGGTTFTYKIADLKADTEYWWRCRANDGYEYSPWSDLNSFITREPEIVRVSLDNLTIQDGINAAEERDTVLVAAGTYSGEGNRDLNFNGINVVLLAEDGPDETVIDCGGTESNPHIGFLFQNDEDSTSIIEGFTITNSCAPMIWNNAAITCMSSPTLKNCRIIDNAGDGILCSSGASPTIIDCIISNNTETGIRSGWSAVKMEGCLVSDNGGDGFAINYGAIDISNCTFAYNAGIGILLEGDPPKISAVAEDSAIIHNCITAFNGGGGVIQYFYFNPEIKIKCTDAYGNDDDDWGLYGFGPDDEFGNMSLNPLFCDGTDGDFGIADISPCAPANNTCGALIGAFDVACVMTDQDNEQGEDIIPGQFELLQNWPNPFNPSTIIEYSLPAASAVRVEIYNMLGQRIVTLVDAEQPAGKYTVGWDSADSNGMGVASGIYLYRIVADDFVSSKKMMLLK